jgi:putative membrane protein
MNAPTLPALLGSHWQLSWSVAFAAAAAANVYLLAARNTGGRWPLRRSASFLAGVACVMVALQSGIDTYDDQLLSVHMVQHMLLLLVAPPLLLGGRPVILALSAMPPQRRNRLARALARTRAFTGPLQALCFFTAVLAVTHLPSFYDATLTHPALHDLEHALYLLTGLLLFSPLLDADPAPRHRLGGLARLAYVLAAMVPMALIGAYLNRHAALVYAPYGPPAKALGVSALDDQAQAGAVMWVVGNAIMAAIGLWVAVAAMVAEERRQAARDTRAASMPAGGDASRHASLAAGDEGARA